MGLRRSANEVGPVAQAGPCFWANRIKILAPPTLRGPHHVLPDLVPSQIHPPSVTTSPRPRPGLTWPSF